MAMSTLLDLAKLNAGEASVGLIEEAVKSTPELAVGAAMTISGVNYNTVVRTGLPTVGFRNANEGVTPSTSTYINRLNSCNILAAYVDADVAVADAYENGGAAAYMALESVGVLRSAYITAGRQFFYGTSADAKGYDGLTSLVDSTMVVDAQGDDADKCTSAYLVRFGMQDLTWIFGNGSVLEVSDMVKNRIVVDSKVLTAYSIELTTRIGLALHNKYAVARICNIDTGKPLTDDLIASAISKFPVGMEPNAIFVNRRGRTMLQQSRTATNVTGAPAPFPVDAFGIPVYATESIVDTEAVVS